METEFASCEVRTGLLVLLQVASISQSTVSRLSRQCEILNISRPYRFPRVTGIAFLFFTFLHIYQYIWTVSGNNSFLVKDLMHKVNEVIFLPEGPGIISSHFEDLEMLHDKPGARWRWDLLSSIQDQVSRRSSTDELDTGQLFPI
jgi:hypothetical protein